MSKSRGEMLLQFGQFILLFVSSLAGRMLHSQVCFLNFVIMLMAVCTYIGSAYCTPRREYYTYVGRTRRFQSARARYCVVVIL